MSEAVSDETDNTVARIQQDLKAAHLTFSQVYKPDPKNRPQLVQVEGIDRNQVGQPCARCSTTKYSNEYDIAGNSADNELHADDEAAGAEGSRKEDRRSRRSRPSATAWTRLGVSEPVIQEYGLGDNQILVELPGISDLDRVKEHHPVDGAA